MHSDTLKSVLKSWILLEATRFKKEMGENQPRWRDKMIRYEEAGGYYVHFSDVPKMGLFIKNKWKTPIGFYAYPLDRKKVSGFATGRKYAIVFKPKPEARLLSLGDYTQGDLSEDVQKLMGAGYSIETIDRASREAAKRVAGGVVWNITRVLSGAEMLGDRTKIPDRGGGPTGKWTMLLKSLGYDGVVDPGLGIIHPSEPSQGVFFSTTKLEMVEVIEKDVGGDSPANLFKKRLVRQNLEGGNFDGQNLEEAQFTGSKLTGASFVNANLDDADFSEAVLTKVNFSGAKADSGKFTHVKGAEVTFERADLANADFDYSSFPNANFKSVVALGARFNGAELNGSDFSGVDLENTEFQRTDLQGANLHQAVLRNAYLTDANLQGANLRGADVEGTSLRRANLQGADLTGVYLWQATVTGATYNKKTKFQRGFDPVASGMKLVETPT